VFALDMWFLVSGLAASCVCAVVEAASIRLKLDDNISIPSSFALTMLVMNSLGGFMSMASFLH
jgi:dolichol kinase